VSFGDHLRAYQNVDLTATESAKHAQVVPQVPHRVAIDTPDPGLRKHLLQLQFEALRSLAAILDVLAVTLGTARRRPSRKTAIMAEQVFDGAVIRHCHTAGAALKRKAAMAAQQESSVTAPVQQNHRLLTAQKADADRVDEHLRKQNLFSR